MAPQSASSSTPTVLRWTGLVLSWLLGLFLLFDGAGKILLLDPHVKGSAELGYPRQVVQGIGIALVASTLIYLLPRTAVLGAILLTAYLGGAVATHVRMAGPAFNIAFASVFGILAWLGLYLRDAKLRRLIPLRRG